MRILQPETLEHGLVLVGLAVAIGIPIEPDLGAVLHKRPVTRRQHAQRHREARGEHPRRRRLRGPRIVDHEHLVAATRGEEPPCGLRVLVGIDRVFDRRRRPEPATAVEGERHEFAVGIPRVFALGEDEFGGEAVGEGEAP